ncbi:glycosyltransferase [Lysinibacillus fusiformis]|uniref:glycosyltransferase n=1 Tax=Lysinibacillus fusiformis TaxID=28031 RepID=UPI003CFE7DFB
MNLAFAMNKKFISHFSVVLKSIENNLLNKNEEIFVYILSMDLSEHEFIMIKKEFSHFHFIWHDLKEYDFDKFFINAHISYETYFRIIIPEIINVDKILYLDCDLIIRKPLDYLYSKDIDSFAVAAVYDYKAQGRKKELEIPEYAMYFNAGVLLMNLKYWRKDQITKALVQYIYKMGDKLKYWDQDALNAVLYDKVLIVEDTWNIQTASFETKMVDEETLKNPAIVHFTGASKPWHISSNSVFQHEYLGYLALTSFKDFKFVSKQVENLLKSKKDIYIWGAGVTGEKVYKYLGIDIKGFIDSDMTKVNQLFNGKPIYSIAQLEKNDDIGIVVCSGYYREIVTILIEHGYIENIDFIQQM